MDSNRTIDRPAILFVCHACDALQQVSTVEPGKEAICIRCSSRLFRHPVGGIDRPLALIIASMFLFIVANSFPIMTLTIVGVKQSTTISGSALAFLQHGSPELAAAVWLPSVFIPGFIITSLFYVLFSIRFQMNWPFTKTMLVWLSRLLPWGMMDVFFLGILVALVKMVALADVVLGTGFYAFMLLIFLYAASISSLEPHLLWETLHNQPDRQKVAENG
jgi:paraquat-inducible protein A